MFSSINYGTDDSAEGRMIMECLLDVIDKGTGDGGTFIFPISVFKVKEGINYSDEDYALFMANPDDGLAGKLQYKTPNFDLFIKACEVSSRRLFPNFVFLDSPFNQNQLWRADDPERYMNELATMGCRTRIYDDVTTGKKTSVGRGNLSFTTLNIVRLGIEAALAYPDDEKARLDAFFESLDKDCHMVCEQLLDRYHFQRKAKGKQLPFLMGQGIWNNGETVEPNEEIGDVINTGSLSMGFIGLAETLVALTGKHHGESEEAQELGLKIVSRMREITDEYTTKNHLNFSLFATPAEGIAGRFTMIDRKKYGIIPGVTDRDFYTNSCHLPVYYHIKMFDKIRLEAPYHALTNAGHIFYGELDGEAKKNVPAFVSIVHEMYKNNIGYGAINHPVDRCCRCGYEGVIEDTCPQCGEAEHIDRIRRITGYLVGTVDRWNSFKLAELKARVSHSV